MQRIGVITGIAVDDPQTKAQYAAFLQGLQQLGWIDGRNVRIDIRWAAGNAADTRKYAAELVALAPDVILVVGTSLEQLLQVTRTVPDRVRDRPRSSRLRLREQPIAAGRQRYRLYAV